jgi:Tfp pilus assembly protein PilF
VAKASQMLAQGDSRGACAAFQQAIAVDPKSARLHLMLAQALEQAGDARKAAVEYDTFVLTCPDDPKARDFKQRVERLRRSP